MWKVVYWAADSMFFVDLVLNFFTTITHNDTNTEITDRKVLATTYLKGWFFIDFFSIVPFEAAMPLITGQIAALNGEDDSDSNNNMKMTMLIRIPRIAKIYKLVKLFRMIKVFKLIKNKDRIKSQMSKSL